MQPQQDEATITRTIIGSPQQTQYGVNLRVLLDNRLRVKMPAQQIKIDNTVIRQSPFSPGQNSTILTQDGVYIVGGVRHIGDSRGNEWYSEITGLTSVNGRLGLAGPNGNTPIG